MEYCKITNMNKMFYGCLSLSSLPDISKWNTNDVKNMSGMFYGCLSLSSLPDISKWNTNSTKHISKIFDGCSNIIISKQIRKKFK